MWNNIKNNLSIKSIRKMMLLQFIPSSFLIILLATYVLIITGLPLVVVLFCNFVLILSLAIAVYFDVTMRYNKDKFEEDVATFRKELEKQNWDVIKVRIRDIDKLSEYSKRRLFECLYLMSEMEGEK